MCSSPMLRPGSPKLVPSSPLWTTVEAKRKGGFPKPLDDVPPLPASALGEGVIMAEAAVGPGISGEAVDLYYDKKELFIKGWSHDDKAPRSIKAKKRIDYQVEKRKQQSARDRGLLDGGLDAVDSD